MIIKNNDKVLIQGKGVNIKLAAIEGYLTIHVNGKQTDGLISIEFELILAHLNR